IFGDDDSKENNVSPAAATTLLTSDLMDIAKNATPPNTVAGNEELDELGVLFREHYRAIFRTAYRITGSQSDAEDVLQTIFLRLTSREAQSSLLPNPQGYLCRAATNASL